jgi:hypothetical protein
MLIVGIVVFVGLVLFVKISSASSQIAAHQAQPRLVLHYPAEGPSPVALLEMTEKTVILDRKLGGLVMRRNQGETLDSGELALLAQLDALGDTELRIGDTLHGGWTGKPLQRVALSVRVKSKEYAELMAALEARGVADPQIVAEALLGAAKAGQLPTLCTTDLALRAQLSESGGGPYREGALEVGPVTFQGRTVNLRQLTTPR